MQIQYWRNHYNQFTVSVIFPSGITGFGYGKTVKKAYKDAFSSARSSVAFITWNKVKGALH